ncbi:MAG: hypothetical protein OXE99_03930, partial [Cellvibrionales bacterium]|nr:hypothetical protein [Cellvibrionales bacterium]
MHRFFLSGKTSNVFAISISVLAVFTLSAFTSASSLVINDSVEQTLQPKELTFIDGTDDPGWKLSPSTPNSSGISVNRFDRFDLDQDLNIFNLPSQNPAKTIIIKSDQIKINGTVEVIGVPANIVFLTTEYIGGISCDSCSFNNISRLSFLLASGEEIKEIDTKDISKLGILNSKASGLLRLGSLT